MSEGQFGIAREERCSCGHDEAMHDGAGQCHDGVYSMEHDETRRCLCRQYTPVWESDRRDDDGE